jgi:hypothetical protein
MERRMDRPAAHGGYMQSISKGTIDRGLRRVLPLSTYASMKSGYRHARALAGRNPGRGRLLPDYLIIGSTKCGTTSLHGWLNEHPFVAETTKEIHFFNMNYDRGADWYRCHFPYETEREQFAREHGRPYLIGEGTASYLAHYWTPQRVAKLVPDARLVVSLRDPADRAHSQYHYFRRRGSEPAETFEEALDLEAERLAGHEEHEIAEPYFHSWQVYRWGYHRTSRYAEHLERWFEVFPREQFLFLSFDEIVASPQRALDKVHTHVGLPAHEHTDLPVLNSGSYRPMAEETRERLNAYFAPHNRRLYELTGIDFGWPS